MGSSRILLPLLGAAVLAATGCARFPRDDPKSHSPDARIQSLLTASNDPVLAFATGDTVHFGDEVKAFYRARGYAAAWTSEEGLLPRGQALIAALDSAGQEGLDPTAYHAGEIRPLLQRAQGDVEQRLPVGDELGNLDLLMSEAYLRYTSDVLRGTIDPGAEGIDWKVPREDATDAAFLNQVLEDEDFDAALAELRPQVPFYDGLRQGLLRYERVAASGGWQPIAPGQALGPGDRGARVARLRARLAAEADPVEAPLVQSTGPQDVFDDRLAQAVEHFQDRMGLHEDGAAGAETVRAMNVPVEERLKSLRLNLDRWRWLPRELGSHYLIVNVAGFEMAVMKDNQPALSMRVIVGKTGHETPIFRDTLEDIVVNPYWNVPPDIAEKEVIPALERDPSYLERNDMEWVGSGANRGIRQRPGPKNALGVVKFLFPNDHDVYLHDTPADELFTRQTRAFSHGCIRLEKPRELAHYLFESAVGRRASDFDAMVGGPEKWVKLKQKLPIYIVYFTAWPDADGGVSFYQDIYRRDARVERVAAAKLSPDSASPRRAVRDSGRAARTAAAEGTR